jgi:hypothetical protein
VTPTRVTMEANTAAVRQLAPANVTASTAGSNSERATLN